MIFNELKHKHFRCKICMVRTQAFTSSYARYMQTRPDRLFGLVQTMLSFVSPNDVFSGNDEGVLGRGRLSVALLARSSIHGRLTVKYRPVKLDDDGAHKQLKW